MTIALAQGRPAGKTAGPSATSFVAAHRKELGTVGVTVPFFAYTTCFLLVPTIIVVVGAFTGADGGFTLANFAKLAEPKHHRQLRHVDRGLHHLRSNRLGRRALASYSLVIGAKPDGLLRRMVSAISSVLAQFGGVMLAFAFIATIGINGVGTMLLQQLFGVTVDPNWLSSLSGLIVIYSYFQIPLMIIVFLPAVDSIRTEWREATESLGGNTFQYWTRVACPILAPRFISAFLLLFANAFSRMPPPRPCSPSGDSRAADDPGGDAQRDGSEPAGFCTGARVRDGRGRRDRDAAQPHHRKEAGRWQ